MAATFLPNPYKILGVDSAADAATIKKAYRKLVLSCHPDKVTDESLKAQKQEEFHLIQQAYETVGDPDNRTKYELELKAKKLREERDRATPKSSPASARHVNVNIFTAHPPPEFRASSSKHSPSKSSSKPYPSEYSRSWEHGIPTRSREYFEEGRKTRRTMSDEKLKRDRDESRERRRREDERERRRQREEESDRRRKREKELKEREQREKERERARKESYRREREREDRELRAKVEKKARERAERERLERETKRRQEAEEKLRPKNKPYVESYSEEDDDAGRSRPRKPSRKDSSPRDKSASRLRERTSPRDEVVPEVPSEEKYHSNMAFAAQYIKKQSQPKHSADAQFSSAEYPDPNKWVPKRRVSGDAKHAKAEAAHAADAGSPSSPTAQAPPRLSKAHTMSHIPTTEPPPTRIPLGRSQTMEPEFLSRAGGADKHRPSRGRTSLDEDDYYFQRPRVSKYKVNTEKGTPRVFEPAEYKDPYSRGPTSSFGKLKTSPPYGLEDLSRSKPYGREELQTSKYGLPLYSDYQSPFVSART